MRAADARHRMTGDAVAAVAVGNHREATFGAGRGAGIGTGMRGVLCPCQRSGRPSAGSQGHRRQHGAPRLGNRSDHRRLYLFVWTISKRKFAPIFCADESARCSARVKPEDSIQKMVKNRSSHRHIEGAH
ncbi:MAG: hypothetical protein MO853_09540 [Candidatus Protistobacter heckmanni]|nr:hypothetical protein [Candidatus Protistobacter heckmanni]